MCDSIVFNVKVIPTRRALAPPSHASASSSASPRASSNRLAPRVFASRRSTYLAYASYVSFDRGARVSALARGVHSDQSLETPGRPRLDHVPDARSIARVCARTRSSSRACSGFVESARCVAAPLSCQSVSCRNARRDGTKTLISSFRRSSFVVRRSSFVPPRTRAGCLAGSLARRLGAFPRTSPPLDSFPVAPRARSSSRASLHRPRSRSPRARPSSETTSRTRAGSSSSSNPSSSSSNPSSSFADRLSRVADSPTRATNRIKPNRTDAGRTPPTRTPFMTHHGSSLPDVSPRADPSRPRARRRETRETATRERARERLRVRRRGRRGRGR